MYFLFVTLVHVMSSGGVMFSFFMRFRAMATPTIAMVTTSRLKIRTAPIAIRVMARGDAMDRLSSSLSWVVDNRGDATKMIIALKG